MSKEVKGNETTKFVLMHLFWNYVVFTLKVINPLIYELRLVDGERKVVMDFIYKVMQKVKETIIKSFNNNENKYKNVFTIIDNRCQLHLPLHTTSHFLNSKLYYSNLKIEYDLEVKTGLYACIKRLVSSKNVQQIFLTGLPRYKGGIELFDDDFVKKSKKTITPCNTLTLSKLH